MHNSRTPGGALLPISLDDLKFVNWTNVKDVTDTVREAVKGFIALIKLIPTKPEAGKESDHQAASAYKPKKGDFVNTILLVGMEGTGKTELIKSCFGHAHADSSKETEDFEIYTSERMVDGKNCWINVADYMGQNIGTLVGTFIDVQRQLDSPLKYKHLHSLIVMVDLRFPEEDRAISAPPAPLADQARVKANLEQWNEMALDAIFGLLTDPPLEYVCVFVNKFDLISEPKKYSKAKAEKNYAALVDYLKLKVKPVKAGGKIKVDVIVGSAKHGDGHAELLASLYRHVAMAIPKKR
jgi:hypothetical protein